VTVVVPLPDRDFDVTEVAVPWKVLRCAGHRVVFATENGATPHADPMLLDGGIFAKLGAEREPKAFYRELEKAPEFVAPIRWSSIDSAAVGGLILPGGHAPGMKPYLESETLREKVRQIWNLGKPVGAICHGVLVLARAGLLRDKRTTCLPTYMERAAFALTAWKLGRRYRTYPAYEEDEVKAALADPAKQFLRGPMNLTSKGTDSDDRAAFVVEDGRYVSARWPGDAYLFAKRYAAMLST
jgi:putative intracellular protease/amidase